MEKSIYGNARYLLAREGTLIGRMVVYSRVSAKEVMVLTFCATSQKK